MTEVSKIFKIKRLLTASWHPATDGLLEKFHSTLATNIIFYANDDNKDWDLYLPAGCFPYNTAIGLYFTGYSPLFLMFGREPLSPLDTVLPQYEITHNKTFFVKFLQKLSKALEVAAINLKQAQINI
jgi:hypothetical protein